MFGTTSDAIEVNVPAREAWELYSSLRLAKLVGEELPHIMQKVEAIQGDGGAGTVLRLTFPPGTPLITSFKEKFVNVDHKKRVKESEVIEGGYLDMGFTLYRIRFEVIEKDANSCITRATVEYDVKEEGAANAAFVTTEPLVTVMKAAAASLVNDHNRSWSAIRP